MWPRMSVILRSAVTGRQGWTGKALKEKIKSHELTLKKKRKTAHVAEDVEKSDPLHMAAGNVKYSAAVENSLAVPQEVQT